MGRKADPNCNTKKPEYKVWEGMKQRCSNPNANRYKSYGGKGIKVCERWQTFQNFYNDMGDRPSEDYTIERIDTSKDYEPNNCIWLHKSKQMRNTTRSILTVEQVREIRNKYKPYVYTRKMLAEEYNVSEDHIQKIIYNKIWKE